MRVDDFVSYDDTKLKWSEGLKNYLERGVAIVFDATKIRSSLYRPFCQQHLYFDRCMVERVYQFPSIFPTIASERENMVICVSGLGHRIPFTTIATNMIPNLSLNATDSFQCFPLYTYDEDGSNRKENITNWAVAQVEARYGPLTNVPDVAMEAKKAIFFYTYALLHHPTYRERYRENLKRELPRIPLVGDRQSFLNLVEKGQQLAHLHIHYEEVAPYPLQWDEQQHVPWSWRVEKMKLTKEKDALIVNRSLTLRGIPAAVFDYQLGNRSALEWVIDQYQVTTDKRSGITNDPNRPDDPEYIVRLVGKVVAVSVETVKLVDEIAAISIP